MKSERIFSITLVELRDGHLEELGLFSAMLSFLTPLRGLEELPSVG